MNQFPNNFDDRDANLLNDRAKTDRQLSEIESLSPESIERLSIHKKQLERLILYLAGFGLALGILLAIILIITLNKLGLTKKPNQIAPQPNQKLEQIESHLERSLELPK